MRISELAAALEITSALIIAELAKRNKKGKTPSSSIDADDAVTIRGIVAKMSSADREKEKTKAAKLAKKRSTGKKEKKDDSEAEAAPRESEADKAAEQAKKKSDEEAKKAAAKAAEEKRKLEEAAKKAAEERRRAEDKRKAEEAQLRKANETRRREEEKKRRIEESEMREMERQIADEERQKREQEAKAIFIEEAMVVKEFAEKLRVPVAEIIKRLFLKGTAVTLNQTIGVELATDLAREMGYTVKIKEAAIDEEKKSAVDVSHLPLRPPVVTIMGHVDHGKTSLLDAIRKTTVAAKEAGGITQHIGAYTVNSPKGRITFIDTPGHEAFTALRARGAKVTDIVVLVVAADDGVMPQTIEAINHSKAAGVTILVAVNKMDKPGASVEKIKQELTTYGLVAEEWGGQTIFCPVSAKTGKGLDQLLEMVQLQSEVLDLRADPSQPAIGTVIESRLDKSRGPVLSVIINKGTLKLGDSFVAGMFHGKVRALVNDKGESLKEAGPSLPVEVMGASEACPPGELLTVLENERKARQISQARIDAQRDKRLAAKQHVRLENVVESLNEGGMADLKLVIKADTQGSVDGVSELLNKMQYEHVKLQVIHSGVGAITETDIMLADASDAIVIGFNIRPTEKAKQVAAREKIDMRLYNIIYEVADDIAKAVKGMLKPKIVERTTGRAEVRSTFKISKLGTIAGCMVVDGTIKRNVQCRLIRDNVVVYSGTVSSLRRFKDDVREVQSGYECGIGLENYNDLKSGDIIELFVKEEAAQPATA